MMARVKMPLYVIMFPIFIKFIKVYSQIYANYRIKAACVQYSRKLNLTKKSLKGNILKNPFGVRRTRRRRVWHSRELNGPTTRNSRVRILWT